ncbi:MAG: nucleotidyltransferase [Sphingomonas sp.]|uniref:nucleotidyltransferase domain-containing protein n=1 Tax=Sphingomonas sp. TaxID=28214 RepID=UPI00120850D5|nr:nucleotidyltransferase [Sphingomonas sp.]THD34493.1 MAG: nucleotidyltransferase [Sphingomonas sp.]
MTYQSPFERPLPMPTPADAMLMDVARRVQLSPTKHDEAQRHHRALCEHVDRLGSPLEGLVVACYPGGSFATGTAIASSVSKDQHDVDGVMELDLPPLSDPKWVLQLLFEAINGDPGSRYHGRVALNSRCVTITYDDGVRVDLMPIVRIAGQPEKAGNLFHSRPESGESYHKPVNPWGFAEHFNAETAVDPVFAAIFESRAGRDGMVVAKAQTDPVPDHVPLSEKAARVVALQLIKRARDVRFRRREGRKPPSIVLAALALEVAPAGAGLLEEVASIATHIADRLEREGKLGRVIDVRNPAFTPDIFSDRWPKSLSAQSIYAQDLRYLVRQLARLRNENASLTETRSILDDLFGETAAGFAVERLLESTRRAMEDGSMRFGTTGRVLTGAAATAAAATATPARASTNMGGGDLTP